MCCAKFVRGERNVKLVSRVRIPFQPISSYYYTHEPIIGAKEAAKANAAKTAAYRAASSGEDIMSELITNVQTRTARAPAVFEDPREKRQLLVDEAIRQAAIAQAA